MTSSSVEINNLSRTLPKLIIFQQPFIFPLKISPYKNKFSFLAPLKLYTQKKSKLNSQLVEPKLYKRSHTNKKYEISDIGIERPIKLQKIKKMKSKQVIVINEINYSKQHRKQFRWNHQLKGKIDQNLIKNEQLIQSLQENHLSHSNEQQDVQIFISEQNNEKRQIILNKSSQQLKKQFEVDNHANISKKLNDSIEKKKISKNLYRVYFGQGNNSQLVKQVLLNRKGWIQTAQHDTIFNLRWEQCTDKSWYQRIKFERYKQTVNHLELHEQISTKAGLVRNLEKYCSRKNFSAFGFIPISFILDWNNNHKVQQQLKKIVFYYFQNHPTLKNIKIQKEYIQLTKILNSYDTKLFNYSFDRPKNYSLPPLTDIYLDEKSSYVWMLKPSHLNRGRGIKLWSKFEELIDLLVQCRKDKSQSNVYVIQKYIQKPLLINQRKFDIRVWAMIDQSSKLYFFQQGYIRTSSQIYQLDDLEDVFVHLTNNAIQLGNSKYGAFQDGNQLSFSEFDNIFPNLSPFREKMLPTLKKITLIAFESVLKNILPKWVNSSSSFQIYGLDFILDCYCKPWLIEVNTNPCLQTSSNVLKILLPRMIDDAFKIVLDPVYPSGKPNKVYNVEGYDDCTNLWRLLPWNKKQKSRLG